MQNLFQQQAVQNEQTFHTFPDTCLRIAQEYIAYRVSV